MPSKNRKKEFKINDEKQKAEPHPKPDEKNINPYEVYMKILNHITSGDILKSNGKTIPENTNKKSR